MIKNILVSQPAPTTEKSPYFEIEKKYNVKIDFCPLIHVERFTEREYRTQHIDILSHTAVIFTSRHAIDFFFDLCKGLRVAIPEDMKYFFQSESIALYIQKFIQYRKRKIFYPKNNSWTELLDLMYKHKKEKYLFPQNEVHAHDVSEDFQRKNLNCTISNMFRTVSNVWDKEKSFNYDLVVFFTPSGVKAIRENFPDYEQGDVRFTCFGEAAANAINDFGFRLDLKAPTPTATSMSAALDQYLEAEINK